MAWSVLAVLAIMPLAVLSQYTNTQNGTMLCTQDGDIRRMKFWLFENDDQLGTVLVMQNTYFTTGMRLPVNVTHCMSGGNGSVSYPFMMAFEFNVTADPSNPPITKVENSDGTDITEFCTTSSFLYTDNSDPSNRVYYIPVKSVNRTDYLAETHHDFYYNLTCSNDVLDTRLTLTGVLIGDVQSTELRSDYNVTCEVQNCDGTSSARHNLGDMVKLVCSLNFDQTALGLRGLDVISVSYDDTADTTATTPNLIIDSRCGTFTPPWEFANNSVAFNWNGADYTTSPNVFESTCIPAYTNPRNFLGDVNATIVIQFYVDCLSSEPDSCLNKTSCYVNGRKKRSVLTDPEGLQETSLTFQISIEPDNLVDNEQNNEQPVQDEEMEMACFQKTSFGILAGVIGLLLVLLLVCVVLLFLRIRTLRGRSEKRSYD